MTYYLKYRPQRIVDLDLDGVRNQLQKIAASGRMPHAFLFSGPRGAGKTSTARIIAKFVNCESASLKLRGPKLAEPCNECQQCKAITQGSSLDVIEIDAASNRGVEDMRMLRDTVKLAPAGSKKKVYIIDEAHMLTTEAANALLKTLEEPPDHAVFILATTAPEKLLDTIRSRCTNINFYKGNISEVVRALKKAKKGEKIEIDDEALGEIAKNVDGSFREAHKILEQLSFTGGKITADSVRKLTEAIFSDPQILLSHLSAREVKPALAEVGQLAEKGVNLKVYLTKLISTLRISLLAKLGAGEGEVIEGLETADHYTLIDLFSEAASLYPTALIPQLPLEVAVVKWCVGAGQAQSAHLNLNSPTTSGGTDPTRSRSRSLPLAPPALDSTSQDLPQTKVSDVRGPLPASREEKVEKVGTKVSAAELENLWPQVMKLTKEKNHSVEALLRAARPMAFDGKVLQIEVFYKFHKERLEKETYRTVVEGIAASLLGGPLRLVCVLTEGKKRAADVRNVTQPEDEDLAKAAEEIFSAPIDGKVH